MKPSEIEGNGAPDYHKKSKVVQPVADFRQRTLTGSLHASVKMSMVSKWTGCCPPSSCSQCCRMTANRIESALRSVCAVRSSENAWISLHGENKWSSLIINLKMCIGLGFNVIRITDGMLSSERCGRKQLVARQAITASQVYRIRTFRTQVLRPH
jgi:hypothetical protein